MSGMDTFNLKEFVIRAVNAVFGTLLSMPVQAVAADQTRHYNGGHIVGSLSFAGKVLGNLNLHVGEDLATQMTAAMLGMETEDIEGYEEIRDVIGEVCDMIGGDLKSRLCDSGLTCELSLPSVTRGKEVKIEAHRWERSADFGFSSNQHTARVEVFMKTGYRHPDRTSAG